MCAPVDADRPSLLLVRSFTRVVPISYPNPYASCRNAEASGAVKQREVASGSFRRVAASLSLPLVLDIRITDPAHERPACIAIDAHGEIRRLRDLDDFASQPGISHRSSWDQRYRVRSGSTNHRPTAASSKYCNILACGKRTAIVRTWP